MGGQGANFHQDLLSENRVPGLSCDVDSVMIDYVQPLIQHMFVTGRWTDRQTPDHSI